MKTTITTLFTVIGVFLASVLYSQNIKEAMKHIFMRNYDSAKAIINAGVDVNQKERDSYLINAACYHGDIDMVQFLIDKGARVNVVAGDGGTPLYWAARSDNSGELVKLLINSGAKLDVKNKAEITPFNNAIFRAIQKGDNFEVLEIFLARGINVDSAPKEGAAAGYTPLMGAVINNKMELSQFLIDRGANVNATAGDGNAPLLIAAKEGNLELVKLLIEKGAKADYTNPDGETALHIAEENSHQDIITYLSNSK